MCFIIATNFNVLEILGILDWLVTATPLNPEAEQHRWKGIRLFLDQWEQLRQIENVLTTSQRLTLTDFIEELQFQKKRLVTPVTERVQDQVTHWECSKHGLGCCPWICIICTLCFDLRWRVTRAEERETQLICLACLNHIREQLTLKSFFSDFLGTPLRHEDGTFYPAV